MPICVTVRGPTVTHGCRVTSLVGWLQCRGAARRAPRGPPRRARRYPPRKRAEARGGHRSGRQHGAPAWAGRGRAVIRIVHYGRQAVGRGRPAAARAHREQCRERYHNHLDPRPTRQWSGRRTASCSRRTSTSATAGRRSWQPPGRSDNTGRTTGARFRRRVRGACRAARGGPARGARVDAMLEATEPLPRPTRRRARNRACRPRRSCGARRRPSSGRADGRER